jgi:D-alanyl-lipoteichoic acid acyltransferase DltB (MBOAT superfamily)
MLFNSPAFLFCYLPIALCGFAVASRFGRTPVVAWLAFMSLVFYGYWRPIFLVLLVGSILVNYGAAALIWRTRERPTLQKAWLMAGIAANLGALCYFKYLFPLLHFFHDLFSLQHVFGNVILPLGISFFTFTQIAYLVDLAQGAAEPQDFVSYVLFVTFFPHLIAGPILHHGEIMPQFAEGRDFSLKLPDVALGLSWFILGLCKKVLIADHLSQYADAAFAHPAGLPLSYAWLGALNYAMQLYFDFSGYSDMAVGLARMFSIEIPLNFDSPYKAGSIIEFWSRWHMTLTRYLTLYLYNPMSLAINRRRVAKGKPISRKATRTLAGFASLIALPTLATMFLAGVWHGAGFQFLVFGTLHGVYLSVNHAWRIFRRDGALLTRVVCWRPVSVLLTFLAVIVGQVFFRAASSTDALRLLAGMVGRNGVAAIPGLPAVLLNPHAWLALLLLPVVWFFPNTQEILGQAKAVRANLFSAVFGSAPAALWRPNLVWATSLAGAFLAVLWYMTDTSSFLYFQF